MAMIMMAAGQEAHPRVCRQPVAARLAGGYAGKDKDKGGGQQLTEAAPNQHTTIRRSRHHGILTYKFKKTRNATTDESVVHERPQQRFVMITSFAGLHAIIIMLHTQRTRRRFLPQAVLAGHAGNIKSSPASRPPVHASLHCIALLAINTYMRRPTAGLGRYQINQEEAAAKTAGSCCRAAHTSCCILL